jgi:hypothetical protein
LRILCFLAFIAEFGETFCLRPGEGQTAVGAKSKCKNAQGKKRKE